MATRTAAVVSKGRRRLRKCAMYLGLTWEILRMSCDRVLVRMTFAVILVAFFNVFAKGDDLTVVPTGRSAAGQDSTETSSAPTAPATESPAATIDAATAKPTGPVSAVEQSVDPLASLDPADRVIAEKIRDLLAAKSDTIFASKSERKGPLSAKPFASDCQNAI